MDLFKKRSFAKDKFSWLQESENNSIMEAVTWPCASVQCNHDWVSELSLVLHENTVVGE